VTTVTVTRRHDLTDAQWAVLAPLLPAVSVLGRPPKWPRRQLIDGMRWRIRVGSPWRDVPAEYAPWQTIYGLQPRGPSDWRGARQPDDLLQSVVFDECVCVDAERGLGLRVVDTVDRAGVAGDRRR
jgi:transposase